MFNDMFKETIKLGSRLHTIASFVPVGSRLGDIGTDHAYLPLYLIQKGIIKSAVGVDIHIGPYESALETVRMYGVGEKITIRQGNGLVPLKSGEIDTLVVAGMGGATILEILQSNPQVLSEVSTVILQPQGAEARVRRELIVQGWRLMKECLLEEDNRVYTVTVFTRTEGLDYKEIQSRIRSIGDGLKKYILQQKLDIDQDFGNETVNGFIEKYVWILGPMVIENKDEHLQNVINENMIKLGNIVQEMTKTSREEIKAKSILVEQERKLLEVMQRWLFQ